MARSIVLALFLSASVPVSATPAVITMGGSAARSCYEAAESPHRPRADALHQCNLVLGHIAISFDDLVATYVNRGIIRLRRGDQTGGVQDLDRALALNSRQPEANLNKAVVLMKRASVSDALQLFSRAIEFDTDRPEQAYYGRGIAHEALGNAAAAYRDYVEASRLDPEWLDPREALQRVSPAMR